MVYYLACLYQSSIKRGGANGAQKYEFTHLAQKILINGDFLVVSTILI
jgi:hypothetical protein